MSTQNTNQEIRSAILRAADRIEREPQRYDFSRIDTPDKDGDCGTPYCMWGWVGFELGMHGVTIDRVADAVGYNMRDLYACCAVGHTADPGIAASGLRAFADLHWPQTKQLDPAFLRLRASLPSLAAQMRAEGKWQLAAVIEQDGAL